jgi:hypothetical protein
LVVGRPRLLRNLHLKAFSVASFSPELLRRFADGRREQRSGYRQSSFPDNSLPLSALRASSRYGSAEQGWVKVKNPTYWRRNELEAMARKREPRARTRV